MMFTPKTMPRENTSTAVGSDRNYYIKIAVALALKFILLTGLWFFCVKDREVHIDTETMAAHLNSMESEQGTTRHE